MPQKILIVDAFQIFRAGLCAIISDEPGLAIAGEADNGVAAIQKAKRLKPDLIMMDLTMPFMNGTEAIQKIKQRDPEMKIIALSAHKSHDYVQASFESGANGYLLKDEIRENVIAAIKSVLSGQVFLISGVCDMILGGFMGYSENARAATSWCRLTMREREVMKLVAEGYKNRENALLLSLSIKTIEKHRASLMRKLNLRGVTELTSYAIEHSLVAG